MTTKRARALRRAHRLAFRLPMVVLTDLWRVVVIAIMLGVGLAATYALVVGESGLIASTLPSLVLRAMWSASFLFGGVFQLIGIQRGSRSVERLGLWLCLIGSAVIALTLLSKGTPPGYVYCAVFFIISAGHGLALLLSSVAAEVIPDASTRPLRDVT